MPTTKKLDNLNVNVLTKSQYDTAVAQGVITDEDLSMITDLGNDIVPQYEQMPVASAENVNQIAQYSGATDSTYTNGYFYKCVSDGQEPATYSWTPVDVQPSDGQVIQYTEMPLADSSMSQRIIQYVGYLNPFYVRGYFYFPTGSIQQSDSIVGVAESDTISRVDVDIVDFKNYVNPPSDRETIVSFICTDSEDPEVWEDASGGGEVSLSDYGIVYSGTVSDYDMIYVKYTPAGGRTWTQTDVQPAPVIPDPLPSQTGNAGKFLTTDGTDASWSDKPLVNIATGADAVGISNSSAAQTITAISAIAINGNVSARAGIKMGIGSVSGIGGIALGERSNVSADGAIQINTKWDTRATNSDANTFKVANANGNFEIMSADGTVPTARLTKVNTTATLAVADWSSNTQTISVSGITANGVVFVSPVPASQVDYTSAGVMCSAQAAGTLTFTCDTVPSNDISVTVVML